MDWIRGKSGGGYAGIKTRTSSNSLARDVEAHDGLGDDDGGHSATMTKTTTKQASSPMHNRQEKAHRRADSCSSAVVQVESP